MIENIPYGINIVFLLIVLLTIGIFYIANNRPTKPALFILAWAVFQSILGLTGFYKDTESIPPRFALLLIPPILAIIYGVSGQRKRWILNNRNLGISTFLHVVRIPVEIILYYLWIGEQIPKAMTLEGRNFDILAGITAVIIGILYYRGGVGKKTLLIWNVISLGLVLFILINGVLSAEIFFQQFGFEQPNQAVTYFPFVLLPAVIVPVVIYTHLTDIMVLSKKDTVK